MELPRPKRFLAFTLIELMVVVALIGIMTAMIVPEMRGTYQDALLRSTSREMMNVFQLASSRAVSFNRIHRVRFNLRTGKYAVERRTWMDGRETFAPLKGLPGADGELDTRITVQFRQSGDDTPDEANAEPTPAALDVSQVPSGEAAVDFYPDGTADAEEILLTDGQGYQLSMRLNPITARVRVVELGRK